MISTISIFVTMTKPISQILRFSQTLRFENIETIFNLSQSESQSSHINIYEFSSFLSYLEKNWHFYLVFLSEFPVKENKYF